MNKRWGLLAAALALIALCAAVVLIVVPAPAIPVSDILTNPITVSSTTLTITGKARGTWYFEASFPIQILNASGMVLAQGPAQAQSDWMTQDFVAFSATLVYPAQPAGSSGTVVLKKDNPSGNPTNDRQVSIPIVF